MKYVVRNEQDLDALLAEQCSQEHEIDGDWEWEGRQEYGSDVIIFNTEGEWFDKKVVSRLHIWEGSVDNGISVTKITPEDAQRVKNTISYIRENFDRIYQVMLEKLLSVFVEEEVYDEETDEQVTTIQQLHSLRYIEEIAGMEAGCITNLQLNCRYHKDDMVLYSLVFHPDCYKCGFDDGFEVGFWKERIVFLMDGNTEEEIFYFPDTYLDWPDCLEK